MVNQQDIERNRHLIGISNMTMYGRKPLEHAAEALEDSLQDVDQIAVIAYAAPNMERVAGLVEPALFEYGHIRRATFLHHYPGDELQVLADSDAVYISGGNTRFGLVNLHCLRCPGGAFVDQRQGHSYQPLIDPLRRHVAQGRVLIGASAGTNVMCDDVRTTNDMMPPYRKERRLERRELRIDALRLLPDGLSVNPHYVEKVTVNRLQRALLRLFAPQALKVIDHQGETRDERLRQVLLADPTRTILAMHEGSYFVVNGMDMRFDGRTGGKIFRAEQEPEVLLPGADISYLLK